MRLVESVKSTIKAGVEDSLKTSELFKELEFNIKGFPNVAPELKSRLIFNTGKVISYLKRDLCLQKNLKQNL